MSDPPIDGVTFEICISKGQVSSQVFTHSSLYWLISTHGTGTAVRNIRHPLTSASICCDHALSVVQEVSVETHTILHAECLQRSLSLVEEEPLTQEDTDRYNATIQAVTDPYVII